LVRVGIYQTAIALIVLSSSVPAHAGDLLPNATDLQAAYCLGAIQTWMESANNSKLATNDTVIKQIIDEIWSSKTRAEKRLKVYLVPRMAQLEISAISGAKNLGAIDANSTNLTKRHECIDSCMNQAKQFGDDSFKFLQTCTANCEGPTAIKLLACEDAVFLPF